MLGGKRVRSPDSCWSWVVCICATISNMLMFGMALSFGVYQPALMEYFDENKERTFRRLMRATKRHAWTGSIAIGLILFSGPFAVFLTDRFGHRLVNMVCGFILSASVMASSFVNHLTILYFSFGVLYGLPGGIILNLGYSVIRMYFRKNWALAVGIVSSGSVIGMLIMTQCNEILIESLGWRNSFRIMSGVIFFTCIASATYDPISTTRHEIVLDHETGIQVTVNDRQTIPCEELVSQEEQTNLTKQNNLEINGRKGCNYEAEEEPLSQETSPSHVTLHTKEVVVQEDSELHGKECENEKFLNPKTSIQEHKHMTLKDCLSLFTNVHFVFGIMGTTLTYFGIYAPHIHLMQFALDLGMSKRQAAQVYIYFTTFNIISRLVMGQIANKIKLSPLVFLQLSEFICGLAVIFLSLAKQYSHLIGFGVVYGIGNGGFITFQVLFAMSVVGPEKSALSLGVSYMLGSVAVVSGPPFAGYIADTMGSYVTSFFVIGGVMVFASLLPCVLRIKKLIKR